MSQKGSIPLLVLTVIFLITFLLIGISLSPFKNTLFSNFYTQKDLIAANGSPNIPTGFIDYTNATNCIVSGWAKDQDSPASSITVNLYKGNRDQGGVFVGRTKTENKRTDGFLGFEYVLPTNFNGSIFAYADDLTSNGSFAERTTEIPPYASTSRTLNCSGQQPPQGFIDNINSNNCTISGWAQDPNTTQPLNIHIYKGGAPGYGGYFITSVTANQSRGDGLKGFSYSLPKGFDSTIYAYAIGMNSAGVNDTIGNNLPVYWNSVASRKVTCPKPPTFSTSSSPTVCSTSGSKTAAFTADDKVIWTYTYPASTKISQLYFPPNNYARFEVSTPGGFVQGGQKGQTFVANLGSGESTVYITAYMDGVCQSFTEQFYMNFTCNPANVSDLIGLGSTACPATPIGYIDNKNSGLCQITGWAKDNNSPSTPLDIKISSDAAGSQQIASAKASTPRSDGLSGFTAQLPGGYSGEFYAFAQGVNSSGLPDGSSTLLPTYTPTVPNRSLVCASPIASDEGVKTVDLSTSLGMKVVLGTVEPIFSKSEWGVMGATPDGHMAVKTINGVTKAFFSCWDGQGSSSKSCLNETSSLDAFYGLYGLYRNANNFISVLPPGDPNRTINGRSYEPKYAGITSVWDDGGGKLHGWYQAEEYLDPNHSNLPPNNPCAYAHYATVGYAISTDGGKTFTKQPPVLDSGYSRTVTTDCGSQGTSHSRVFESGDYLYMLFDWWTSNWADGGVGIARTTKNNPTVWLKYYNGSFSQPGLGGLVTPVIKRGTGSNANIWSPYVIWSGKINKFIMMHTDFSSEGSVYIRTSTNLISWSNPQLLFSSSAFNYRYPSLFGTDDRWIVDNGWIYFARTPKNGNIGPDSLMARRKITFQ